MLHNKLSGAMILDGEFLPIYVREETGDAIYETEQGDLMMVGELCIKGAMDLPTVEKLKEGLANQIYGEAIGVIYSTEGVYVLMTDSLAELRDWSDLTKRSEQTFEIDLDVVDIVGEDEREEGVI